MTDDTGNLGAAYGLKAPDNRAQVTAIVNYLNAHGGLLGHKIIPVFAAFQTTSTANFNSQAQAACKTWTVDHQVVAVINPTRVDEPMIGCLDSHNIPLVVASPQWEFTTPRSRLYPFMAGPNLPIADQAVASYVDQLATHSFFETSPTQGPTKIGLVLVDDPERRWLADNVLMPALHRHGLTLSDRATASSPQSFSDVATMASEMSSASFEVQS